MEWNLVVENKPENQGLIGYLLGIRPARVEYYRSWSDAVDGDRDPRKTAVLFDWTVSTGVLAEKIKKRFAHLQFTLVKCEEF